MKTRLDYYPMFADAFNKIVEFGNLVKETDLDKKMLHLVKIRVSQINHCTFCVDMHVKQSKIDGELEIRLYHLPVWQESKLFTLKEKSALRWAEAVTRIAINPVSDSDYEDALAHFTKKELVQLTAAIIEINSWNRLAGTFQSPAGSLDKAYGLDKAGLNYPNIT